MTDKFVVAPGVTIEVSETGEEFYEGDEISPADFPTIAEFKGFLAAGRIIPYVEPEPEPEPAPSWDYWSIDEALDEKSANPVSNRGLYKAFANEAALRKNADDDLSERLSAEETARKSADDALSARIDHAIEDGGATGARLDKEIEDRAAADAALSSRIDSEQSARIANDSALEEKISDEETARTEAIAALETRIGEEEETRKAAVDGVYSSLNLESQNRISADNEIKTQIETQQTRLSESIEGVRSYTVSSITDIQNQLNVLYGETDDEEESEEESEESEESEYEESASDRGKSIRAISAEEVAKVIAEAPESFDTLKEISDWIFHHEDDASAMNSAISANTAAIATLNGDSSTAGSVDKKIADAIAAIPKVEVDVIPLSDVEAMFAD